MSGEIKGSPGGGENIDAEFERLMAGLELESNTSEIDAPGQATSLTQSAASVQRMSVALVLTPVADAKALTALLAAGGIKAEIIPAKSGSCARIEVPAVLEDEEFAALLGEARPVPEEADKLARQISKLMVGASVVLLVSWLVLGDDIEPGVAGQITARRYCAGEPEEELPAGLIVASMDRVIEDLLTAQIKVEDVAGRSDSAQMSKLKALRTLGKLLRGKRNGESQ